MSARNAGEGGGESGAVLLIGRRSTDSTPSNAPGVRRPGCAITAIFTARSALICPVDSFEAIRHRGPCVLPPVLPGVRAHEHRAGRRAKSNAPVPSDVDERVTETKNNDMLNPTDALEERSPQSW
jgi:hypothetical protein